MIRSPAKTMIIWPGDCLEIQVPEESGGCIAIEPSVSIRSIPISNTWSSPSLLTCIAGKVPIPNTTTNPLLIRKNSHFARAFPVFVPGTETNASECVPHQKSDKTASSPKAHSQDVTIDPDGTLPTTTRKQFKALMEEFDNVFDPRCPGYYGFAAPLKG